MSFDKIDQPLELLATTAVRGWMDYNGHMNVASYVHLFDRAIDQFLNGVNLGQQWIEKGKGSVFALQNHIHYLREVSEGQDITISLQMLDMDQKRLHLFLRMNDAKSGRMVAASELLSIYVDMNSRKSAALPDQQYQALQNILAAHKNLPKPRVAGHKIGTNAKLKLS